jgi:hypothetical protein
MQTLRVHLLLVVTLFFVVGPVSWAEKTSVSSVAVTPYGGLALFELKGDLGTSTGVLNQRLMGGLAVDLGRGKWRVETGLGYLQAGSGGTGKIGILPYTYEARSDFLFIPVVGKFVISSEPFSSLFVKGGIAGAYLLRSEFEIRALGRSATEDVTDKATRADWFFTLGLGGRFNLTDEWDWQLELNYLQSQSDASDGEGRSIYQGFVLLTGFSFRIPDEPLPVKSRGAIPNPQ